jgi:hypothetical protein
MFDEQRLGNVGTRTPGRARRTTATNQMKEKDEDIADPGMVSKPEKHLILARFGRVRFTAPFPNVERLYSSAGSAVEVVRGSPMWPRGQRKLACSVLAKIADR